VGRPACQALELPWSNAVAPRSRLLTSRRARLIRALSLRAAGKRPKSAARPAGAGFADALPEATEARDPRTPFLTQAAGLPWHDRQRGIVAVGAVPLRDPETFSWLWATAAFARAHDRAGTHQGHLTAVVDG